MKLVGRGDKGLPGQLCGSRGDRPVKAIGGIESRADRRAAERQLPQGRQRGGEQLTVPCEARPPAGDLLRECSWSIKKHYKTSNEAALLCRNKAATTFPDISSVVVAVFL